MVLKNMIQNFIRDGYVEKRSNLKTDDSYGKVGFHLERWLKKALTFLNVAFYDKCCGATAINATATATTNAVLGGLITSTSAAVTSITLPTATLLGVATKAVQGSTIEFTVDNVGVSVVTVVVGAGIVAASALTGGTVLTIPAATVGSFKIYFKSATAAQISRIF
jgi:hypothetical protein